MSFSDYLRRDVRLVCLRILADLPGYRSNSSVISNLLDQFGHAVTRDQTKTELRWLEEQGLVTIEDVLEPYLIQQGYLQRTLRGRIATPAIYRHLGISEPNSAVVRDLLATE